VIGQTPGRTRDGILVTRPASAAAATGRSLTGLGWRPVFAPMLRVVPTSGELPAPDAIQAVLITSANAIAFLPDGFHGTPLLAVGDATAERARHAGFLHVESAGADAAALAELVAARRDPAGLPLLLAGAAGQGDALAGRLTASGFRLLRHAVYDAQPVSDLPDAARLDLEGNRIAACMFFSPATARAFLAAFVRACPMEIVLTVEALAISEEAAAPIAPLPWRRIRVARRPNHDELLALLP
jgi:uroporphyrinogen-III synthase